MASPARLPTVLPGRHRAVAPPIRVRPAGVILGPLARCTRAADRLVRRTSVVPDIRHGSVTARRRSRPAEEAVRQDRYRRYKTGCQRFGCRRPYHPAAVPPTPEARRPAAANGWHLDNARARVRPPGAAPYLSRRLRRRPQRRLPRRRFSPHRLFPPPVSGEGAFDWPCAVRRIASTALRARRSPSLARVSALARQQPRFHFLSWVRPPPGQVSPFLALANSVWVAGSPVSSSGCRGFATPPAGAAGWAP